MTVNRTAVRAVTFLPETLPLYSEKDLTNIKEVYIINHKISEKEVSRMFAKGNFSYFYYFTSADRQCTRAAN